MSDLCPVCGSRICAHSYPTKPKGSDITDGVVFSTSSQIAPIKPTVESLLAEVLRLHGECERLQSALALANKEVELHQRVDYWHERGKAAEFERDKLKAQNAAMTEALQKIAKIAAYDDNDTLLDIIKSAT